MIMLFITFNTSALLSSILKIHEIKVFIKYYLLLVILPFSYIELRENI